MAATTKPVRNLMKKSENLDNKELRERSKRRGSETRTHERKEKKEELKSLKPKYKELFGKSREQTAKGLKKHSL